MLDHECYDALVDAALIAARIEAEKPYFKEAALRALRGMRLCIEKHRYADFWNDFEEEAILWGLAVRRLQQCIVNFNEQLFDDFEDYVKEQLEKDILRRKLK